MYARGLVAPAPATAPRRPFSMSYTLPMRHSICALSVLLAFTASLGASTVVPMSFSELVNESAAIVYGRVADVRGQWTQDRHAIESLVTLDVLTAFKGSPGSTTTFSVPGGQSGRFL